MAEESSEKQQIENGDTDEKESISENLPPELWSPQKGNCEYAVETTPSDKLEAAEKVDLPPEKWTPEKVTCKIIPMDHLPPEEWTPKKPPRQTAELTGSPRKHPEKKRLCYEEIMQQLDEKIKVRNWITLGRMT